MQLNHRILAVIYTSDWLLVTSSLVLLIAGFLFARWSTTTTQSQSPASVVANSTSEAVVPKKLPTSTDTAVEYSIRALPRERAVCRGPDVEQRGERRKFDSELKMVLVMRRDLKPSETLSASWGSTVALEVVQHVRASGDATWISWLRAWQRIGVAKIATRVDSSDAMLAVITAALDKRLPIVGLVESAGAVSEVAVGKELLIENSGSKNSAVVCVAIGPAPNNDFVGVTDSLKLY